MLKLLDFKKMALFSLKPDLIFSPAKYLFIFSHMRSRSSVLAHILGSNDGICGYSELHRSYRLPIDLLKIKMDIYHDLKCDLEGKYLLDKILHNKLVISKRIFNAENAKCIFLIRDPVQTLKSIINMGNIINFGWYSIPEKVSEYYCSRLAYLVQVAQNIDKDFFLLDSDDLIDNTHNVFSFLADWLKVDPISYDSYKIFNHTGEPGFGDPTSKILAGRIVKATEHKDIDIPKTIIQKTDSTYDQIKKKLTQNKYCIYSKFLNN